MSDPTTPEVRDWIKRTEAQPPDAHHSAREVMARLPEVRQRRRWWPFPVIYRNAQPAPKTTDTTQYEPSPIPATNGHSPTVIGRTQTMFSPVKAITAGALVFAIGTFLIAQPLAQQGSVPGAETEAIAPTWVTGNIASASTCTGPDSEQDGAVRHDRNYECSPQMWTASDPRFTGEVSYRWNEDVYKTTGQGLISVNKGAAYLQNDDGGWVCSSSSLLKGFGLFPEAVTGDTLTCVGAGGYEGLSALLVNLPEPTHPFVGLIFSGDFPPLPEAPAAE